MRTHVPPDAVAAEADGTRILLNTAQVASISPDERPADNITSESTYIQDRADLHVTKLAQAGTTIRAGELFTYTIYVDNLGPSCVRTVTLNDEILSSGTFELVNLVQDPDRADQCMLGAGGLALDCALDDPLEADGRWTLQLVLRANEAQDVSNLVEVNSATPDPFLDNNRATAFVSVTSVADLDIGKTAIGQTDCDGSPPTIDAVTAGGTVTYTLVARNNGPSTAENMVVQDPMPPFTTIAHVTTTQGLCTQGALWHCYLGSLSPGGSVTMTVVAEVWPSVLSGTVLYNEALVSSDTFDPDNTNNLGTNETTVRTAADLTLLAAPHTGTVTAGDMLTYTLVAYNGGPSNAANIVLRDTLPLSTTMVGVTATQGQCDQYAPRCDLGPLAPGDRVTMTVVAGVWPSVLSGTVLYNEALVSGNTFDPNGSGPISMTTIVLSGVTNRPPTANAGSGQTVLMGALVTLEASGSSDPEGDALTYSWAQTGGTAVALSDPAASQITFTAPNTLGVLTFVLTVTDSQGLVAQDTVEVTVTRHTIYLPLLLKLSLPLTKEYGVKSQLK